MKEEKQGTSRQTLALFWEHAKKYPGYIAVLAVLVPTSILLHQFAPPLIISHVIGRLSENDFTPHELWQSFSTEIMLYAVVFFFGTVIGWRLVLALVWRLEANITRDMSRRIYKHLLSQSAHFHANRFSGALVSQTAKFTSAYIRLADTTIFSMSMLIIGFIATSVILLPIAPMFVIGLYAFAIIYISIAFMSTRKIRDLSAAEARAVSRQTGQLADSISNVMAVKSFAANTYENERFAEVTEETRTRTIDLMKASLRRDLYFSNINAAIMIGALIVALSSVVVFQNADVATVFLVLTYAGNISRHLWDFSTKTLRNYNRALGDAREMTAILNEEPDVKDPSNPEESHMHDGTIIFRDMTFSHADAKDDPLFSHFNITIDSGEKIGLVGRSGSGKTTLTKLLLRYSDINSGEITIDGQNIASIRQDDLRRSIAYVPQEPMLFHRSLRENIAYGKPDATDEEIDAAARKAHAAEFIDKLPEGYDTTVGERGVKLSGGQRQRIAIARAILKDAPILVLDEATSALDSESERLIQDALEKLMRGRTAIVIAHRLSTIQKMDKIIVLDNGNITEQGSHQQLLAQKGAYAYLWAHQSGDFIEE